MQRSLPILLHEHSPIGDIAFEIPVQSVRHGQAGFSIVARILPLPNPGDKLSFSCRQYQHIPLAWIKLPGIQQAFRLVRIITHFVLHNKFLLPPILLKINAPTAVFPTIIRWMNKRKDRLGGCLFYQELQNHAGTISHGGAHPLGGHTPVRCRVCHLQDGFPFQAGNHLPGERMTVCP